MTPPPHSFVVERLGQQALPLRSPTTSRERPRAAQDQRDLFGSPLLPGFATMPDVVTGSEEAALIAHIEDEKLTPFQFQQWKGKRLTRSFGWTYDFQTGCFGPGDPMPPWLVDPRARAACAAGLAPGSLEQALLISYGIGAGIGWHRDRPVFEHVLGLSLGEPAKMRFRRRADDRFERAKAELTPRAL